jgi:glycine cleavage system H protein
MNVPDELLYTSDHEWVKITGDVIRVGITDYAQDALGDVVYIQLPTVGDSVSEHQSFCEIESTKSVNDVYAPLAGEVLAVNDALTSTPELLNTEPYGSGWICEMKVPATSSESLLTAAQYRDLIGA